MSIYKLHWISGSAYAWRVMLTLSHKNIEYESQVIDAATWDREASGFLKLNPRGKVPVLEDGDNVIYESMAIMAYLERKHPENPLFGTTDEEAGIIWQRINEIEQYAIEPMLTLAKALMMETALNNIDTCNEGAIEITKELSTINAWLDKGDYLAGNSVSAADYCFYPMLAFLERLSGNEDARSLKLGFYPIRGKFNNLEKWMDKIENIPGFLDTYPPHWKE